jgi:hypothetical protein
MANYTIDGREVYATPDGQLRYNDSGAIASGSTDDNFGGGSGGYATGGAGLGSAGGSANAIADYLNTQLYGGILDRAPDQSGFDYWMKTAGENNWTTDQLRDQFVNSAIPELMSSHPVQASAYQVPAYQSAPTPAYTPSVSAPVPEFVKFESQPFNFEADPGYAFRKQQADESMQKRQLATGNFFSGGALKEAADYGGGLASQEYGDAFQRYLSKDAADFRNNQANNGLDNTMYERNWNTDMRDYNRWTDDYNRTTAADNTNWSRLAYLDSSGQNAANQTANVGQNTANNVSGLTQSQGDANAAGYINSANAWTNSLGNAIYGLRRY